jgi:hypothetical protein
MGNEHRLSEFQLSQVAAPRANAEPLPGALATAFGADDIVVDGTSVRKVVPGDWIILKQLDSPVYRMHLGDKAEEIEWKGHEEIELVFQFIRPIAEVRQMLRKGREYFTEQAMQAITDGTMENEQIARLVSAVTEQFNRYFAIRLKYIQDTQTEGKETVTNFQEQPAQVKQA